MSNMISAVESTRLDDLTAVTSTILNHITGEALDLALIGVCKRYGRSDRDFRNHALNNTHPDDLISALVLKGYSLSKFGIVGVSRS